MAIFKFSLLIEQVLYLIWQNQQATLKKNLKKQKHYLKHALIQTAALNQKKELQKIGYNRYEKCLNADKAVNKNWIGSKELKAQLQQFVKENQL